MILLDTHAVIWMLREPEKLSPDARQAMLRHAPLCISAASLYEIALKGRRGKWPQVADLLDDDLSDRFKRSGIDVLPLTGAIMQRAGALGWDHRDPFDRMTVVTALERGVALVSKDTALDSLGDPAFRRIW